MPAPPPAPQRPMREACMCVSRGSSSSASCRQRSPWRCSKLAPAATASTMGTSGDAARGRSAVPQLRCDSLSSWRAAASKHQPPGRGPPNSQRRRQPRHGVPCVVGAPPRRVCARPDALQPAASPSRQQLLRRAALLSACAPTHAGEQLIRACNRTRHPGIAAAGRGVVRVVLYPHVPGALRELSHALHCCPAAMQCV